MDITVTGRKTTVTDRFRRHLEGKLDKVPQLAPRVSRVEVVLTHEANPRLAKTSERVEITCFVQRTVVRAEAAADEEYAALDLAMTRLVERLRRMHDKRRVSLTGKHRPRSVAEATNGLPPQEPTEDAGEGPQDPQERIAQALGTEGNSPIELREKVHPSEPMTVADALSRMELVGHDFFLFHDADNDLPSVVYRRRGWSYGVLRLDPQAGEASAPAPEDGSVDAAARDAVRVG